MKGLTEYFAEALGAMLQNGFELPIHVAVVAVNGSMMFATYSDSGGDTLDCDVTANHIVGPGLTLPINVMFVDSRGEAARVIIENSMNSESNPALRFVN